MFSRPKLAETPAALKGFCEKLHEHLPLIYLLYSIPAIVLIALITPPFQVPDERNHFCRAEQVSTGRMVAFFHTRGEKQLPTVRDERVLMPDIGGFKVNKGIGIADSFYDDILGHQSKKVEKSKLDSSGKIYWNLGMEYAEFPNTAIYPPTGYIMSAFGIVIGKLLDLSVVDTLYLSRCLNGFLCAFLCFYALRLAKASRLLLFTVLLFPMTLSLFASVSQDGLLISLACIFLGLIGYVEADAEKHYSRKQMITMVIAIAAIGAARPPYFILSFLFFFLNLDRRTKLTCFMATLVPVVLWGWLNRHNYAVVWAPPQMKINAALQIKHILADPLEFISLFFRFDFSYIKEMVYEFIGVLGSLDLRFPSYFYLGALISLIFAAAISTYNFRKKFRLRLALVALTIATFMAILTAQYITWVELEARHLGGLQGRYFIPVFFPVAFALAGFRKNISIRKWQAPLFLFILIFPFISTVVSVCQLIRRYYLVT